MSETVLNTEMDKKDKIFTIMGLAFKCGETDQNMQTNKPILSNNLSAMKKINHCGGMKRERDGRGS